MGALVRRARLVRVQGPMRKPPGQGGDAITWDDKAGAMVRFHINRPRIPKQTCPDLTSSTWAPTSRTWA